MLGTHHLNQLFESLGQLYHLRDEDVIYHFLLTKAAEVLHSQAGTFYKANPAAKELTPVAAFGIKWDLLKELPFRYGKGVCGWVAAERKGALVQFTHSDSRFDKSVDTVTGFKTKSVVSVPVQWKDSLYGVLELLNRAENVFRDNDLEFLEIFAKQGAVALENAIMYQKVTELSVYTNSVIDSLSGGFLATDRQGRITICNQAAAAILGVKPYHLVGKRVHEALAPFGAFGALLEVTLDRLSTAKRQEIQISVGESQRRIGYSTLLIADENKTILGAGILFQDLTTLAVSTGSGS